MDRLPGWTYRRRLWLVPAAVLLMVAGLAALLGIPGLIEPMRLETDSLDYIDKRSTLYRDTRRFEATMSGLTVIEAWIRVPNAAALEYIPAADRENPALYPPREVLDRCEVAIYKGEEVESLYSDALTRVLAA